ncbi:intersectin-1-like isoform X2 [Amphiura filiformis]|uniref:intersectin-1-like isoform X2 n=1 Tax=Amphiura filiformis TaxID=82378 RepID=UPI003B227699
MMQAGYQDWRIAPEDRAKHDAQFFQLKPIAGFITGEQARGFFLQSGLPQPVLGHIWGLADMNGDGKMDQLEFSIAMYLIKRKLQGIDLPKVLPPSLKQPAMPGPSSTGMAGFGQQPMGMAPIGSMAPMQSGGIQGGFSQSSFTLPPGMGAPRMPAASMSPARTMGGFGSPMATSATMPIPGRGGPPPPLQFVPGSDQGSPERSAALQGEWAIPHASKLKYKQMFNTYDRTKNGFLTGPQARNILMQYGLPQNMLAQIWQLSDVDSDGKLTSEEFVLALHLVDLAKSGQALYQTLPPNLVPLSYRRARQGSLSSSGAPPSMPMMGQLGGPPMSPTLVNQPSVDEQQPEEVMALPVTFEDKKKENFDRGQQELERRRAKLRDEQQKEKERQQQIERQEREKKERIILEQERRRQMEQEKMLARQREFEAEQEAQRQKMIEQREAARRELERQRQLELVRQKRQELEAQRIREQGEVAHLKSKSKTLACEIENLEDKKNELNRQLDGNKSDLTNHHTTIILMSQARDSKVAEIERLQNEIRDQRQIKLALEKDRDDLSDAYKKMGGDDKDYDTHSAIMQGYNNKKKTIEKLKEELARNERELASILQKSDASNTRVGELKPQVGQEQMEVERVRRLHQQKKIAYDQAKLRFKIEDKAKISDAQRIAQEAEQQRLKEEADQRKKEDEKKQQDNKFDAIRLAQQHETKVDSFAAFGSGPDDPFASAFGSTKTQKESPEKKSDPFSGFADFSSSSFDFGQPFSKPTQASVQQAAAPPLPTNASTTDMTEEIDQEALDTILVKYKAVFQFDAQNEDELSIKPGDIIMVARNQSAEPGWLGGECNGRTGWFPDNYAEKVSSKAPSPTTNGPDFAAGWADFGSQGNKEVTPSSEEQLSSTTENKSMSAIEAAKASLVASGMETKPSSTIAPSSVTPEPTPVREVSPPKPAPVPSPTPPPSAAPVEGSEIVESMDADMEEQEPGKLDTGLLSKFTQPSNRSSFTQVKPSTSSPTPGLGQLVTDDAKAEAVYNWEAKKENHLSFKIGDVINLKEEQDMWYLGELGGKSGWFPKTHVKKIPPLPPKGASPSQSLETPEPAMFAAEEPYAQPTEPTHEEQPVTPVETKTEESASLPDVVRPSAEAAVSQDDSLNEEVVAIYAYTSEEPGDLLFQAGETIRVTKKDGDWWTGCIEDRTGVFPANYVQPKEGVGIVHEPPSVATPNDSGAQQNVKKPEIAQVLAPYQATGAEQLSLTVGQVLMVRKKNPSGWWEGELQARGKKRQIGWFPANYVRLLSSSTGRATPMSGSAVSPSPVLGDRALTPSIDTVCQVITLYPYVKQNEDELSFQKGTIVNVVSKEDPDWWTGEASGNRGVFPSNYVKELATTPSNDWTKDLHLLESLTLMERNRQSRIHELIATEETYVEDLRIAVEIFKKPIEESGKLTQTELNLIFVNWRELITCNNKLVKALRVRKKMSGENQTIHGIGDILCEQLPRMTSYIRFCSCNLNASTFLQKKIDNEPEFKEYIKNLARSTKTKGMPMSSYLIKPMQRITRYPMLIDKILKYTPEAHSDYSAIKMAKEKAEELCQQVNEGVRERENSDKLEWLQSHVECAGLAEELVFNSLTNCLGPRKFLHSGKLHKAKSNKELFVFLFNDFLLFTTPVKQLQVPIIASENKPTIEYRMYKHPLFLNEIEIKTPPEGTEDPVFQISHIDKVFGLRADSMNELKKWTDKLGAAAKHYVQTEKQKREKLQRARSQRTKGVGRLLVVIIEGHDLKPSNNVTGRSDPYCEVRMGSQEHKTRVVQDNLNPVWDASMQFTVKDLEQDVLCITVYDRDLFSPNDFLGRTEVRVADVKKEASGKGPLTKRLLLHEVTTGEVVVKLDLHLYEQR